MHKNSIKSGKTRGQPKGRSPRKNRCPKPTCLCCRPAGRQAAPLTFIGMVQSRWWVNSKNRACSMIDLDSTQAASWNKEEISGFGSAWHCTGRFIWSLWGSGSPCCISRRPLPETEFTRSESARTLPSFSSKLAYTSRTHPCRTGAAPVQGEWLLKPGFCPAGM